MPAPRRSSGPNGVVVAVVAVAVLAGACATARVTNGAAIDSPPTSVAKHYQRDAAGLTASITDHLSDVGSNLNEWAPPRSQSACAAQKVVQKLGVDRLLALGYDPSKGSLALAYTPAEETAVVNLLVGCIDFGSGVTELLHSYSKLGLAPSACVGRGVDRLDLAREVALGVLRGKQVDLTVNDSRVALALSKLMVECLDPQKDLPPIGPENLFPQDTVPPNAPTTTTTLDTGLVGGATSSTTSSP